jgi:hypothetical protein
MKARLIAAAAALVSAPLAQAQQAAQPAAPTTANVDPRYASVLPGSWSYSPVTGGTEAVFRDASARPQLFIRCTRATRGVTISKPASAPASALNVWTSSTSRNLGVRFDPATARISAELATYDALLDAIAYSRGRFAVSASGGPQLVLPAWPEALRPIEDCRA